MKVVGVLLMFVLFLVQCKKDENSDLTVIVGKVKDKRSGEAVAGIQVDFFIQGVVNGVFNNNYIPVTSATSDSNGDYRLEFDDGIPSSFRMEMEGEGYYFSQQDFNPEDYSASIDNQQDLLIDSRAWVKLRVINENISNGDDQVNFSFITENNGCLQCCENTNLIFNGQVNETIICEAFGNSLAKADGIILDAIQGQIEFYNEVMLIPQDTTELSVAF